MNAPGRAFSVHLRTRSQRRWQIDGCASRQVLQSAAAMPPPHMFYQILDDRRRQLAVRGLNTTINWLCEESIQLEYMFWQRCKNQIKQSSTTDACRDQMFESRGEEEERERERWSEGATGKWSALWQNIRTHVKWQTRNQDLDERGSHVDLRELTCRSRACREGGQTGINKRRCELRAVKRTHPAPPPPPPSSHPLRVAAPRTLLFFPSSRLRPFVLCVSLHPTLSRCRRPGHQTGREEPRL